MQVTMEYRLPMVFLCVNTYGNIIFFWRKKDRADAVFILKGLTYIASTPDYFPDDREIGQG